MSHKSGVRINWNNAGKILSIILRTQKALHESVQLLSHVRLFTTPWTTACQASLSITNSQSLLKLMSMEVMMPSNHLILCHPQVKWVSEVAQSCPIFATLWTVAYQASPSMGFSRQEYWSGLPFPSPGDLPDPGIEPGSPALEADALTSDPPGKPQTSPQLSHHRDSLCAQYHRGGEKHGPYFCPAAV